MLRWLVPLLYCVSSVAALIYELAWMRMLSGVLGVAFVAAAIVLAAYMGGLGLGSALASRWAPRLRRPLAVYALVELALAGWAVLLPTLMPSGREVLAIALVVIPSALTGATYPLLVQTMAPYRSKSGTGAAGGRLYAVGTAGGVLGVVISGEWLLPQLGVLGTTWAAALLGAGTGVIALWASRRISASAATVSRSTHVVAPPRGVMERRALMIVMLSGAAAMIYELVWFRALRMITTDTTRSLSSVLAAFLLGIALGAELATRRSRNFNATRRFAWIGLLQVAVALYALLSPHILRLLDTVLGDIERPITIAYQLGIPLLILLLPALALGATFPLALSIYGDRKERSPGSAAGDMYAASTFGAIAGVALGAVLVAWIGARAALLIGAAANGSAAWIAIRARNKPEQAKRGETSDKLLDVTLRYSYAPLAFAAATLLLWRGEAFFHAPAGELIARAEDTSGVVHVVRDKRGVLHLHANRSHRWGSNAPRMVDAMKTQGKLPLVLHPAPSRLIEIGLGTGVQLQPAVLDNRVTRIDIIELSPAIVEGAHHFASVNGELLSSPKTTVTITDGRHFIETASSQWDVIVLGLFTPYRPGAGQLFGQELYNACRQRLGDGGVMVHWLPLAQLSASGLRTVIRTFLDVFPNAHAWQRAQYLALVSAEDMAARIGEIDSHELFAWVASYAMGPDALATLSRGAPSNTRAHPVLELGAVSPGVDQMLDNMQTILEHRTPPVVSLPTSMQGAVKVAHRARGHSLRAVMAQLRGDHAEAEAELSRAAALNPADDIVRAEVRRMHPAVRERKSKTPRHRGGW